MKLLGKKFILLGALIAEIMSVVASEEYLTVVVNVAPNLKYDEGNIISKYTYLGFSSPSINPDDTVFFDKHAGR